MTIGQMNSTPAHVSKRLLSISKEETPQTYEKRAQYPGRPEEEMFMETIWASPCPSLDEQNDVPSLQTFYPILCFLTTVPSLRWGGQVRVRLAFSTSAWSNAFSLGIAQCSQLRSTETCPGSYSQDLVQVRNKVS